MDMNAQLPNVSSFVSLVYTPFVKGTSHEKNAINGLERVTEVVEPNECLPVWNSLNLGRSNHQFKPIILDIINEVVYLNDSTTIVNVVNSGRLNDIMQIICT